MKSKQFSIRARLNSFRYAWAGVHQFFSKQHNAFIHLLATLAVVIACLFIDLSKIEIISLVIVTGFVWVAEIVNSAIEEMMDLQVPRHDERVKIIKDLAAAAVLMASITAFVTGCIILIPKILVHV